MTKTNVSIIILNIVVLLIISLRMVPTWKTLEYFDINHVDHGDDKVSVIIPTYNRFKYLLNTIKHRHRF